MTVEEFKNTRFCAGMKVKESGGRIFDICAVDFRTSRIGVDELEYRGFSVPYGDSPIAWLDCESCEIVEYI